MNKRVYWLVNTGGFVVQGVKGSKKSASRKTFGNYFATKTQAQTAKTRMIRLFERVKAKEDK